MAAAILVLGITSDAGAALPSYQAAVAGDTPALYYQFDEAAGSAVNYGSLGFAFDGTYFGTPSRSVATAAGDAGVYLDSSDDYIASLATAPAQFTGNPPFTIEIVVGIPTGAIAQLWPPFLHWGTGSPQTGRSVWLSLQNNRNNVVFAGFYNSGLRTQSPITLGRWHHIVWVRAGSPIDSQAGTTLYIDGVAVPLVPDTDLLGAVVPNVTSTNFLINRGHDFTRFSQGFMDELALYDRALSQSEVEEHFTASGLADAVQPGVPVAGEGFDLDARPNPFHSTTAVRLRIGEAGPVLLTVHDTKGCRVATLVGGHREAGEFMARWDGRNDAGVAVAPGVSFVQPEMRNRFTSRTIERLR
jgi:hypothetical protein